MKSQIQQDNFVMHYSNNKKNGFFLDIGANDGYEMSNTYRLEKELGWSGICLEPHPEAFKKLTSCRSCECINKAIYIENNQHLKLYDPNDSTLASLQSHGDIDVTTISWSELLKNCPKEIDYISLDIEGLEPDVLNIFPFEEYKIKF